MAATLTIRPAGVADAAQLVELWVEFGSYYDAIDPVQFQIPQRDGLLEWMERDLQRERPADELWLVADRGGMLVGYVRAQILRPNDADASRHILRTVGVTTVKTDSLMVTDSERRLGVATVLMESVEIWGQEREASEAFVISYAKSPTSVPFYEARMGYQTQTTGYWKALGRPNAAS
jgi:GNAT superfamily N-acetyltransferase